MSWDSRGRPKGRRPRRANRETRRRGNRTTARPQALSLLKTLYAEATGRLLHLQGTAAAAQVQRRAREQLGERETVSRAARRILQAFVDWGVLLETNEKRIYRGASKRVIDD